MSKRPQRLFISAQWENDRFWSVTIMADRKNSMKAFGETLEGAIREADRMLAMKANVIIPDYLLYADKGQS